MPTAASSRAGRDIIWRSRAEQTPELLAKIIADPTTPAAELPRYFRAFDFLSGDKKRGAIERLAFQTSTANDARQALIVLEAVNRLEGSDVAQQPANLTALEKVLDRTSGTSSYVALVDRFQRTERYPELVTLAAAQPESGAAVDAIKVLCGRGQQRLLAAALKGPDIEAAAALARTLGNAADQRVTPLLVAIVDDKNAAQTVAQESAKALGKTRRGANELLRRIRQNTLAPELKQAVAFVLQTTSFDDNRLKGEIDALFPPPPARNDKPLPPLAVLIKSRGDAARGKAVFNGIAKCNTCHVVNGAGKEVGPNLSEIGSKLSREAFFESILFPSAGISHSFETWTAATIDGNVITGIKVSETPAELVLRGSDSISHTVKKSEIEELKKQPISLMPADLQKTMTAEELIDVVEYAQTLKKR